MAVGIVGALDAIELRDAVRFAFPNPTLHTVPVVFAVAELAFNLKMSALRMSEGEFRKLSKSWTPPVHKSRLSSVY